MCGDDNRHLGMVKGALTGNRVAVIEEGGLDLLVGCLDTSDSVLLENVLSALAGSLTVLYIRTQLAHSGGVGWDGGCSRWCVFFGL